MFIFYPLSFLVFLLPYPVIRDSYMDWMYDVYICGCMLRIWDYSDEVLFIEKLSAAKKKYPTREKKGIILWWNKKFLFRQQNY